MSHDWVLIKYSVRAMKVTCVSCNLEGDVTVVHFGEAYLLVNEGASIFHATQTPTKELSFGDFAQHPREFVLYQLEARDWAIELYAAKRILAR
jgi:hypothetical protein